MPFARSEASFALRCSINELVSSIAMQAGMKHELCRQVQEFDAD
jgi:hypothetical protein